VDPLRPHGDVALAAIFLALIAYAIWRLWRAPHL
jgi:hypothetical protein